MAETHEFRDPSRANALGVVAVGGPLTGTRLLQAYRRGIFPWSGDPVRWHSPDPRSIFWQVKLPRRLSRMVRQGGFRLSFDRAFDRVMRLCADHHRAAGAWITAQFIEGYNELHAMGHAHSVEVWRGDELVGGLYGVQVAGLFSGESMFYLVPNASKVAFAALALHLDAIGIALFDSQVINHHTHKLGAVLVRRTDFLRLLGAALDLTSRFDGAHWPEDGGGSLQGTSLAMALSPASTAPPLERISPPFRFWTIADRSEEGQGRE